MKKVLLVEDDQDLAQLVSLQLQDIDVECRWISNGREALEVVTNEIFDLLLLDVMLPEVDGLEICRTCLLYTSPSPRDRTRSRMPSSA